MLDKQVKLIREKFEAALGKEGARMVDINTIDGFQVQTLPALTQKSVACIQWLLMIVSCKTPPCTMQTHVHVKSATASCKIKKVFMTVKLSFCSCAFVMRSVCFLWAISFKHTH